MLAYDLGSERSLDFGVDGLNCTIVLPADDQLMLAESECHVRKSRICTEY
jgi:hypothetical protein